MALISSGKVRIGLGMLPAVLGPLLMTLGCQQSGPLSENDLTRLRAFAISQAELPADPSNGKAADEQAAKLGKLLFFETRFSGPLGPYNAVGANGSLGATGDVGKVGCASCHDPISAGADHRSLPDATSLGAGYTARNSPSVINSAYAPIWQFWDGRRDSLWSQALSPPEGIAECNSSRLAVVHLLADKYSDPYQMAFEPLPLADLADTVRFPADGKPGDPYFEGMNVDDQHTVNQIYANFGKAIAAYERLLISPAFEKSAFDRYLDDGDDTAMTPAAIRGAKLFIGRAGCAECHTGPLFTDFGFHNVGTPQEGEYVPVSDSGRLGAVDGVKGDMFNRGGIFSDAVDSSHLDALTPTADLDDDQRLKIGGQFKTPSLRNVSKTSPYMHDGVYRTLWDVVNHYNFGGETGLYVGAKDPAISPLLLSNDEVNDLVEFLSSLDDGSPLPSPLFPVEGLTGKPALP